MNPSIQKLLKDNPKVGVLYNYVSEKLRRQKKEIAISILNEHDMNYGEAIDEGDKIRIILKGSLEDKVLRAVFIHELGEADYIASQLPKLHFDDMMNILWRLYECFTHHHINQLIKRFELMEEILPIASKRNSARLGEKEWENIIVCLHEKITWNIQRDLDDQQFKIIAKDFCKAISVIENIKTDELSEDNRKKLELSYNEVIEIIKKLGCVESIVAVM